MEVIEWDWTVLSCVEVVSWFWLAAMFLAQQLDKTLPPRRSVICGSAGQPFLHMQDWYTMVLGDTIAVPFVASAFVHLAVNGEIGLVQWTGLSILAIVLTMVGLRSCVGENHKPDQGFPGPGKISVQGALHMPYFGLGWSMGLFAAGHLVYRACWAYPLGWPLWAGLLAGIFYLCCMLAEIRSGNFDPLKKAP